MACQLIGIMLLILSLIKEVDDMRIRFEKLQKYIALVTIENPSRLNALTREMMTQLSRIWDELDADDTRCIILTGTGTRAFCVGADIKGDLRATKELTPTINRALLKTDTYSKPIIAALNGDCIGGGLELMLSTDIRYATPSVRFGLPEVKWSIYPFGGATIKLIQQIGHVQAMDLLLTGRLIDSELALELGLINQVVNKANLLTTAIEKAECIASNSPSAVQAVKTQISATIAEHAIKREKMEQELGDHVRSGKDFAEGIAAFLEKRSPIY